MSRIKLTDDQKKKIIADYISNQNYCETARMNNISEATVRNIVKKEDNEEFTKMLEQKKEENTQSMLEMISETNNKRLKTISKIVDAIERAYERGIKIRILTDKLQASGRYSLVTRLYKKGINIRVHSIHKIEHNKFAIYDGKTVSTGSYNWTNPASYKNSENCLFIINNKQTIEDYQNRFNYLWKINKKSKSDKWFDKKLKL